MNLGSIYEVLSLEAQTRLVSHHGQATVVDVRPTSTGVVIDLYELGQQPTLEAVVQLATWLGVGDTDARIHTLEERVARFDTANRWYRQRYEQALAAHTATEPPVDDTPPSVPSTTPAVVDVPVPGGTLTLTPPTDDHYAIGVLACACGFEAAVERGLKAHITTQNAKRERLEPPVQPIVHARDTQRPLRCMCGKAYKYLSGLDEHLRRMNLSAVIDDSPAVADAPESAIVTVLPREPVPVYDAAAHVPREYRPYSPHVHLTRDERARARQEPPRVERD